MTGWFRALLDAADELANCAVDVIVASVGYLGTFRRSPVTGLWHTGTHQLHLQGNQPTTDTITDKRTSAGG